MTIRVVGMHATHSAALCQRSKTPSEQKSALAIKPTSPRPSNHLTSASRCRTRARHHIVSPFSTLSFPG
eukprot:5262157-Amphidinium_carterae.1